MLEGKEDNKYDVKEVKIKIIRYLYISNIIISSLLIFIVKVFLTQDKIYSMLSPTTLQVINMFPLAVGYSDYR